MRRLKPRGHQSCRNSRALSLVEAVISMVIVGLTLVAALNTAGASRLAIRTTGDRLRGKLLAQALMSEILRMDYADPDVTPLFGPEAGEAGISRAAFDDVDDYDGWSASPPQYADGTDLTQLSGWQRDVTVEYASPTDLTATTVTDQGVKRITVQVTRHGAVIALLTAVRTGSPTTTRILIDPLGPPQAEPPPGGGFTL